MCRHFAYLGPSASLHDLVYAAPFGLERQSYAPRRQQHGLLNADGFGFGWYVDGQAEPVRYRRAVPLWGEENVRGLARVTRSHAILGAVRSATPGHPVQEGAAAPFTAGRWLFSHNGAIAGWPDSAASLAADLPFATLARQQTLTDSTLIWALLLTRLEAGEDPGKAVAAVTTQVREATGARTNLLLLDGEQIVATTAGDILCHRQGGVPTPGGDVAPAVIVASEPFDDADGWVDVPDNSLLVATAENLTLESL
ncbi:ergothioneine biosynthesis protein EgtC [Sporichthya polymorpha]|uniref:ergothioneine biosynthesis protein EgtC n=1 Tax=Sporichthya polymorpha TaxID=35751 RepID=UPI00037F58AE|nr:ergothioneine biosynthesis protein EgtC [Sporichthya polymorpha]